MLKKLSIISSFVFLVACSSNPISDNYADDVVVQKNSLDTHTEIVGKQIIPVDLLENNLALKVSVLNVLASISNDNMQLVDSVVNVTIEYREPKIENREVTYNLVTIAEEQISLKSESVARDCDDKTCLVTQSLSFPVATALLENGRQDGVLFILQQSENSDAELETMIPARYLTALFNK
ncbi:hypothetical protein [Psychromonas hadalis]|uniref:hypothetical protein n=1 Tax=Psychromonas hadalis TaxID=211669 RepID=UPI0003B67F62|nr:hypothetical protein [Psychromonas hadalis]